MQSLEDAATVEPTMVDMIVEAWTKPATHAEALAAGLLHGLEETAPKLL